MERPWTCPVCNAGLAPDVKRCDHIPDGGKVAGGVLPVLPPQPVSERNPVWVVPWTSRMGSGTADAPRVPYTITLFVQPEHNTSGETCWCGPKVERYEHGDVIIHNDEACQ